MGDKKSRGARKGDKRQVAALPVRVDEDGNLLVLLITSRETRRWVLPKGNLMKGKTPARAAAIEAIEEAGVVGKTIKKPYDSFQYWKRGKRAFAFAVVDVYLLIVAGRRPTWKEKGQRRQVWVTPSQAALMVLEPELQTLLQRLDADDVVARHIRENFPEPA